MYLTTKQLTQNWTVIGVFFIIAVLFAPKMFSVVFVTTSINLILTMIFFIQGGNNQEGMKEANDAHNAKIKEIIVAMKTSKFKKPVIIAATIIILITNPYGIVKSIFVTIASVFM